MEHINQANAEYQMMGSELQILQQRKATADIEALLVRIEISESSQRTSAMKKSSGALHKQIENLEKDQLRCSEAQSEKTKQTFLQVDGMHEEFWAKLHKTRREIRELKARIAETEEQKQIAASFSDRIGKKEAENAKFGAALKQVEQEIKEVQGQLQISEAELDWIVADHDEALTAKRRELDIRDAECAYLGGQVESLEEQMNDLTERGRTAAMVTESLREKLKRLERR